MLVKLTHKGWFGLCPIYIGDPDTESPYLEPRIPYTGFLIDFSAWVYQILGAGAFPITFTGELDEPKWVDNLLDTQ